MNVRISIKLGLFEDDTDNLTKKFGNIHKNDTRQNN